MNKEDINKIKDVIYPNQDDFNDKFWKHNYLISLGAIGTSYFVVNADNEQDALDYVIDYIVDNFPGLVMSNEEEEEEEYLDEYIQGGNESKYLNVPYHELRIEIIK